MEDPKQKAAGKRTKLQLLQATNNYLIDRLSRESGKHKFGAVQFNTDVRVLTSLGTLTTETAVGVQKKINGTRAGGLTNLVGGILQGIKQQTQDPETDSIHVVFVFTDGAPTVGEIRDDRIIAAVKKAVDDAGGDVRIYTFGYGNVRFDLLNEIANIGRGVFYLIAEEEDVPKTFGAALGGLLTEVATKLKFTLTPKEGAEILEVLHGGTAEHRRRADGWGDPG